MKGKGKMKTALWLLVILLGLGNTAQAAEAQKNPAVLLQEALYQEETEGNLDKAIELYGQVLEQAAEVERLAARANYQLGLCHLKKGDQTTAAEYFQKVVSDYPKQTSVAKKAAQQLEKIAPENFQSEKQTLFTDSFEEGTENPNGWEKGAAVDNVSYVWDKNTGSDGKASLCLKKDAQKYFPIAQWTRSVAYEGNAKELSVSAQVRARKAYKAVIDALFLDDKDEWIKHEWVSYIGAKESGDPPANHNWTEYSGTVEIPENTKTIVIGLQIYGPGTVWFDQLEVAYVSGGSQAQDLVEDFFKHNYRDITSRKSLEWGEPVIDENGNISIRYKYEATIWDNEKKLYNHIFTFDKNGKYLSVVDAELDPLQAENLTAEGWQLWQARKLAEAESKFQQAVRSDPKNDAAYQGLGWAQFNQGKNKNAEVSFKKCIKLNPQNAAALNGLGWIAYADNDKPQAIQWWEKAVKAQPGTTAALNGLTKTYMEMEEYDKAAKYYQMWLKAEPDNQDAKDGLEKAKQKKPLVSIEDIKPLIKELSNPEAPRFAALNKLIDAGTPAVEPLIDAMKTSNNWQIPKALGAIGDKRATGSLIEKWNNSNTSPMKDVIAESLEKITHKSYAQDLKAWQNWWEQAKNNYTPQATLQNFMQAALAFDVDKAMTYVAPDSHDYDDIKEIFENSTHPFNQIFKKADTSIPVKITKLDIDDTMCIAAWQITLKEDFTVEGRTMRAGTTLDLDGNLHQYGDKWLITGI